jgi:putative FmdB family regulatory protein
MPTYVYACDSCGVQFEKFQSFKEAPLQDCPECRKETIRRVFQPVGIVFKGSGWYINDSRSSNASLSSTSSTSSTTENTSETTKSSTESTKSESSTPSTESTTSTSPTPSTTSSSSETTA